VIGAPPIAGTALMRLDGIAKAFFGVRVLDGISFDIHAGEVLGIVGENGSGKSTAMNIVAGVIPSDGGTMTLDGRPYAPLSRRDGEGAGIAFVQQELNIFPNLCVGENLLLGRAPRLVASLPIVSRKRLRARAVEILESVGLHIDPDVAAGRLSSGERQLLEIARGLSMDARVIIFDEPTTSLTAHEAERLFELVVRIKAQGIAIVFISHALDDVLRLSDRLIVMRDGRVAMQGPREGMTAERLVVAMVGHSIDAMFPERPLLNSIEDDAVKPVLQVERVCEAGIVRNISLSVRQGEIVGLSGLMGSGRSELARIIFGLDPHIEGIVRVNGVEVRQKDIGARLRLGMAFLTEDRRSEGLMMDASVAENVALGALPGFARRGDGWLRKKELTAAIERVSKQLRIKCDDQASAPVRSLSGGNQQKVLLGRWLLRNPSIFILDEPTRGVDVGAKEEIYRLLARMASQGMGILLISSEIEELLGLCDRIAVMHRGAIESEFERQEFDRETILLAAFGRTKAK
jgi:ribose transport system ATP-binding protein